MLLRSQAAASGVAILRDQLVELSCVSDDFPDNIFVVYWPFGSERMNVMAKSGFSHPRTGFTHRPPASSRRGPFAFVQHPFLPRAW